MNTGQQQVNTKHWIITVPLKLTANYIGWPLAMPLKYLDALQNDKGLLVHIQPTTVYNGHSKIGLNIVNYSGPIL